MGEFLSKQALKRVAEIFSNGTVQEKHQQISLFIADGHSLLYSGDVRWKLTIPSLDQVHRGMAESFDHALPEIKSLLEGVMQTLHPATKVSLVVETNDN
jgi:hypothetical protein